MAAQPLTILMLKKDAQEVWRFWEARRKAEAKFAQPALLDEQVEVWRQKQYAYEPWVAYLRAAGDNICTFYNHKAGRGCKTGPTCRYLHKCLYCRADGHQLYKPEGPMCPHLLKYNSQVESLLNAGYCNSEEKQLTNCLQELFGLPKWWPEVPREAQALAPPAQPARREVSLGEYMGPGALAKLEAKGSAAPPQGGRRAAAAVGAAADVKAAAQEAAAPAAVGEAAVARSDGAPAVAKELGGAALEQVPAGADGLAELDEEAGFEELTEEELEKDMTRAPQPKEVVWKASKEVVVRFTIIKDTMISEPHGPYSMGSFKGCRIHKLYGKTDVTVKVWKCPCPLVMELQVKSAKQVEEQVSKEKEVLTMCQCKHIVRMWDCTRDAVPGPSQDIFLHLLVTDHIPWDLLKLYEGGHVKGRETNIARQLADALLYIHEQDVVHGDLKPESVLVTERDDKESGSKILEVKLCNFALGKKRAGATFSARTGQIGTAGFMAPEVADMDSQGSSYTQACDVWSLGCILFWLYMGKVPFEPGLFKATKDSYRCKQLMQLSTHALAHHVVEMMVRGKGRREELRKVRTHPYFWSTTQQLNFVATASKHLKLNAEKTLSPPRQLFLNEFENVMKPHMEQHEKAHRQTWEDDVKVKFEAAAKHEHFRTLLSLSEEHRASRLLRAVRNLSEHLELSRHFINELGNFLSRHPYILNCLWDVTHDEKVREFVSFKHDENAGLNWKWED